jgi:hypothetical protein
MSHDSLERALADFEMLIAAYPDEIRSFTQDNTAAFPLRIALQLSPTAHCDLQISEGYPVESNLQVTSYRSNPEEKGRMEAVLSAIRGTSEECLENQVEGAFACCAAGLEAWKHTKEGHRVLEGVSSLNIARNQTAEARTLFRWIIGEPLIDRKSTFLAHACRVTSEADVRQALHQLLDGNSKLQRSSHNMFAYRLTETISDGTRVSKHDNDDDGEYGAGSKLAHLLQVRDEKDVVVLGARWFGGVHLGPKRFAHISNAARDLLETCHKTEWKVSYR